MINTQEETKSNYNFSNYSNLNFLINIDDFTVLEQKREFEFSKIRDSKTKQIYHMKKISYCLGYDFLKTALKAIETISEINHPCIEKLIGFAPISKSYDPYMAIVCDLGFQSLSSVIHQEESTSSIHVWDDTKKLINAFGIAYGMAYLHSNNIIHRNLTPFNIYVDFNLYPKICDFIYSIKVTNNDPNTISTGFGTPLYLAPEVINNENYTKSIDVYSYGLILYEIFTGEVPHQNMNTFKFTQSIVKGERPKFPTSVPKCQRELIESCWSQDPNKRPTFSEICLELKNNSDFKENINEDEFLYYIESIEEVPKTPNCPVRLNPDILIDITNYEKVEEIGEGSYGKVLKVKEKSTGNFLAAKSFYTEDSMKNAWFQMLNEVNILTNSKNPTVINIYGYSFMDLNQSPNPTIILKLAKGSLDDIFKYNKKSSSFKDWNNTKKIINAYDIAVGMRYLHSNNILHRDLKPANILEDEFFFPKICDFELSKKVTNNDPNTISCKFGTPLYLAPEVINNEKYTKSVDVYSYGLILYEIFTGEVPYQNLNILTLAESVIKGERPKFPTYIAKCQRELIELCWSQDPNKRPTFSKICTILRTEDFLIDVNVDEFNMYVNYVEGKVSFDSIKEKISKSNFFELLKQIKLNEKLQSNHSNIYEFLDQNVVEISLKDFTRQDVLGRGAFAKVFTVYNKSNKEQFAAKILKKQVDELNEEEKKRIIREINFLSKMNQETVIKFIGYCKVNFKNKPKPTIVTEIAFNGSLENILENERKGLTLSEWNDTKKFINIFGIASGMKYIHSLNIIHRDLKPGNILLDKYLFPKLTDFGLSKYCEPIQYTKNSEVIGTAPYTAPEVWENYKHTKSSDVYAFAMILYEIITGEKPFNKFYNILHIAFEVGINNYRPPFLFPIPDCYKSLIESCWDKDPNKRPTFEQIIDKLKSNPAYMNENVNLSEFISYTEMIHEDYLIENKQQLKSRFKEVKITDTKKEINKTTFLSLNKIDEIKLNKIIFNLDDFKPKEILKKEEFSKIIKIVDKKNGNAYEARISNIDMNQFSKEEMVEISEEFFSYSQLNHPSIVKFIGFSPFDFKKNTKPVLITEFVSNKKTLKDLFIKNQLIELSDAQKLIIIYGIASGMSYLHSCKIIHQNLNNECIFLDDNMFPKISDFGILKKFHLLETMTFQSMLGIRSNAAYSSPEILQNKTISKACDVYSFAIIIFELLTGEIAFRNLNSEKVFEEVVLKYRPDIQKINSRFYRELIEKCWSQNEKDRPTFKKIAKLLKKQCDIITDEIERENFFKYVKYIDKK